jgi:hypothetical protein
MSLDSFIAGANDDMHARVLHQNALTTVVRTTSEN